MTNTTSPTTPRPIAIPVTEYRYEGTTATTDHVLQLTTGKRFGIGGVPAGQEGRKTFGGPMVQGPWAYAFGLATVICANRAQGSGAESERNLAAGREHVVTEGDRLTFDGITYEVQITDGFGRRGPVSRHFEFINLVAVEA